MDEVTIDDEASITASRAEPRNGWFTVINRAPPGPASLSRPGDEASRGGSFNPNVPRNSPVVELAEMDVEVILPNGHPRNINVLLGNITVEVAGLNGEVRWVNVELNQLDDELSYLVVELSYLIVDLCYLVVERGYLIVEPMHLNAEVADLSVGVAQINVDQKYLTIALAGAIVRLSASLVTRARETAGGRSQGRRPTRERTGTKLQPLIVLVPTRPPTNG